jgi:ribonuclease HII
LGQRWGCGGQYHGGQRFAEIQQDFPIDKIKDSKDLFKKVRSFLSKSYENKETYFSVNISFNNLALSLT